MRAQVATLELFLSLGTLLTEQLHLSSSQLECPFVIISSWDLVASKTRLETFLPPRGDHWNYVILDEAHEIKNQTTNRFNCIKKICHKPGTKRFLLTGVPFQNDPTERHGDGIQLSFGVSSTWRRGGTQRVQAEVWKAYPRRPLSDRIVLRNEARAESE